MRKSEIKKFKKFGKALKCFNKGKDVKGLTWKKYSKYNLKKGRRVINKLRK